MKNLLLFTFLLIFVSFFSNAHTSSDPHEQECDSLELFLIKKIDIKNLGEDGPAKKPSRWDCPIRLYYISSNNTLHFVSNFATEVDYYIYNANETILQSGSLTLTNDTFINLLYDFSDIYCIEVTTNGITYQSEI